MSPWQEILEEHDGVVQTALQCPLVCEHCASPMSPTLGFGVVVVVVVFFFFFYNGTLWTPLPCHAKGVTCVCHKWALV